MELQIEERKFTGRLGCCIDELPQCVDERVGLVLRGVHMKGTNARKTLYNLFGVAVHGEVPVTK